MDKKELVYEIAKVVPEKVVVRVENDLTISEDIDFEVDRAAASYGYYAVISEKAETRVQRLEMAFDVWKSEIANKLVIERAESGEKKHTIAEKDAIIQTHPKYKAFQLKLIEYREQKRIIKALAKAFEKKADLIQTKASNRRSERGLGRR